MLKKLLSSLLVLILVLGCCTAVLAADAESGIAVKTLKTTIDSITIGIYANGTANSRVVLTYPAELTLRSAESKLPEEAGITDLDTATTGTVSFAWAAYEAQAGAQLLELTFGAKCGAAYEIGLCLPETEEETTVTLQVPYRFTDVQDPQAWYYDAVYQVYGQGLMVGVGGDRFAPDKPLNRATVATVLYRLAGSPEITGDSPFTDVRPGTWYSDAVLWASENGIALGYGNGIFAPGRAITRQELATMLYRFWLTEDGGDGEISDLADFTDAGAVAGWAQTAMSWAVGSGIIAGLPGNLLAPAGSATRAQVAQVVVRYQAAF